MTAVNRNQPGRWKEDIAQSVAKQAINEIHQCRRSVQRLRSPGLS